MPFGSASLIVGDCKVVVTDAVLNEGCVCFPAEELSKFSAQQIGEIAKAAKPYAETFYEWTVIMQAEYLGEDYLKHDPDVLQLTQRLLSACEHIRKNSGRAQYMKLPLGAVSAVAQMAARLRAEVKQKSVKSAITARRRQEFNGRRDSIVLALIERDGYQCNSCGALEDLTVDHKVPLSRGGSDDLENCQFLCRSCNSRKGDKLMEAEAHHA